VGALCADAIAAQLRIEKDTAGKCMAGYSHTKDMKFNHLPQSIPSFTLMEIAPWRKGAMITAGLFGQWMRT
jgi:hypothetical protein